jgi:cysteine desulfurase
MNDSVYMDCNATVPVRPAAARAVADALALTGNASSVHGFGRAARRAIEDARERVAALVATAPENIVFTGGGTEANNLALAGTGRERILVSAVEHDSVLAWSPAAEKLPVDALGLVRLDALAEALAGEGAPALVSIMLANNETGVIQPVAEAAAIAKRAGALVHCDAVQAAGKIALDFDALGVDLLSLSAHKIGGPQGVGALVVATGLDLAPSLRGGGQERRRRAGTENLPGIAGFGAAADAARTERAAAARLADWRDDLERRVHRVLPAVEAIASAAPRLPNTSCLATPGLAAETQVMALDLAGIAVSAGSACSSGKVTPSHVLRAMGRDDVAADAIRISLGWCSTQSDIDRFVAAWQDMATRAGLLSSAA